MPQVDSFRCSRTLIRSARLARPQLTLVAGALVLATSGCEIEPNEVRAGDAGVDESASTGAGDSGPGSAFDAAIPADDAQISPADDAQISPAGDAAMQPQPDGSLVSCGTCPADKPVCLDGMCVECTSTDDSKCAGGSCDTSTHTCIDPYRPFQLDCANLPTKGKCEGGPREVLLATHESGLIAMLDPVDGHFLGYFKRNDLPLSADTDPYWFATQGPDQCIWTVREGEGGISRWDTEGAFVDTIIKPGDNYDGADDVVQDPRSIAFTEDSVYVASTYGYPEARIVRYDLAGKFDKIVLDDGTEPTSLLVTGDGSLIVADDSTKSVSLLPADGSPTVPVIGNIWAGQLAYAGGGRILVPDMTLAEKVFSVDLATQQAQGVKPFTSSAVNVRGVAQLANGQWLISGSDDVKIAALDPASTNPTGQLEIVWDDPAIEYAGSFKSIGRACVSEAFVAAQASKPAETSCPGAPAGVALLDASFEGGGLEGFVAEPSTDSTVTVDATTGADSTTHSLKITGGSSFRSGVAQTFSSLKPSYIGYFMKLETVEEHWTGYLAFKNSSTEASLGGVLVAYDSLTAFEGRVSVPITANTWVRIEMRNIDWTKRSYDLYVDCARVAESLPLGFDAGDDIDRLDLFNNLHDTSAEPSVWFDEIVIK